VFTPGFESGYDGYGTILTGAAAAPETTKPRVDGGMLS
jgi:hypothetical protein